MRIVNKRTVTVWPVLRMAALLAANALAVYWLGQEQHGLARFLLQVLAGIPFLVLTLGLHGLPEAGVRGASAFDAWMKRLGAWRALRMVALIAASTQLIGVLASSQVPAARMILAALAFLPGAVFVVLVHGWFVESSAQVPAERRA